MDLLTRALGRLLMKVVTLTTTFAILATMAVQAPEWLRGLQKATSSFLGWLEENLGIPGKYMLWAEISGMESIVLFLFLQLSVFLLLLFGWYWLKRAASSARDHRRTRKLKKKAAGT